MLRDVLRMTLKVLEKVAHCIDFTAHLGTTYHGKTLPGATDPAKGSRPSSKNSTHWRAGGWAMRDSRRKSYQPLRKR